MLNWIDVLFMLLVAAVEAMVMKDVVAIVVVVLVLRMLVCVVLVVALGVIGVRVDVTDVLWCGKDVEVDEGVSAGVVVVL